MSKNSNFQVVLPFQHTVFGKKVLSFSVVFICETWKFQKISRKRNLKLKTNFFSAYFLNLLTKFLFTVLSQSTSLIFCIFLKINYSFIKFLLANLFLIKGKKKKTETGRHRSIVRMGGGALSLSYLTIFNLRSFVPEKIAQQTTSNCLLLIFLRKKNSRVKIIKIRKITKMTTSNKKLFENHRNNYKSYSPVYVDASNVLFVDKFKSQITPLKWSAQTNLELEN